MGSPNGGGGSGGGANGGGAAPSGGGVTPTSNGPTAGHLNRLIGSYQPARPSGKNGKPLPAGHQPVRKVHGKKGKR